MAKGDKSGKKSKPKQQSTKTDKVLADAVELAREAVEQMALRGTVGEHERFGMDSERVGTHYFTCLDKGYFGWVWAATLARAPRQKFATVDEVNLIPAEHALLTPEWLPYADRLAPGDVGPGDITPFVDADPLLEKGYEATGDEEADELAIFDLGLGRPRVLSPEGREAAAQRWYDGEPGPSAEVAKQAPAHCSTCGYLIPMAGSLRQVFGVCANAWSPSDGGVVSYDHGCGAHSEVDIPAHSHEQVDPMVVDDYVLDTAE